MEKDDWGQTRPVLVRRYGEILRAGWLWIVITCLLSLTSALVFLQLGPRHVTATSIVNIEVISTNPFNLDRAASSFLDIATEIQLAKSWRTATLASENLGEGWEPTEIRERTEVTTEPTSTILRISFTSDNADRARHGADGVAAAYLDLRHKDAQTRADTSAEAIDMRLDSLSSELVGVLSSLADAESGSPETAAAETDRQLITQEIESLVSERARLYHVTQSAGQIIAPAIANGVSYTPNRVIILAGSLLVGMFVGGILAFVRERTRRRIKTAEELISLANVTVWRPDANLSRPWSATLELFYFAVEPFEAVSLVYPSKDIDLHDLAREFAVESADIETRLVPSNEGLSDVLFGVRNTEAVVLFLRDGASRQNTLQLITVLSNIGRPVIGVVFWPREHQFGRIAPESPDARVAS